MFCQVCGAKNQEEQEYCRLCGQRLLVISGPYIPEDEEAFDNHPEEQLSFDEHLLERISILEEVMRRTAETVRQVLSTTYKLEQKILINQTGITTLRDLLESKQLLAREEWSELWEGRMDYQLLALEKRERFTGIKDRIAALYRGDRRDDFRRLLDNAEYSLLSFDIESAIRSLERAHELDLKNYELSFFLAETFFNEGHTESARHYFNRVLEVKPSHYESLVYGGVLCHEEGASEMAEQLLKHAVTLYPEAFLPSFSLGAIYASEGRLPQAVLFLERAVSIDPIPQAFYLLGSCCYEMGRLTSAIQHLRETVRLDPAFEDAYYLLGLAYLDRRWYRKAQEAFRESQRLNSKQLDYSELIQLLSGEDGRLKTELSDEGAEWLTRAEEALKSGQASQALSSYRRALASDPENPPLLLSYAMACLELGRRQEIRPVVEKVIRLDPGEHLRTTAYATLIEALRSEGKYREGNSIGQLMLSEGESDFSTTIACFEIAYNLAEMEEELDEALVLARRSLEVSPADLRRFPLGALGWVHFKRREFEQAIACLSDADALEPNSPRTLTHLGMAFLASGDRETARQILVRVRTLQERRSNIEINVLEALKDRTRTLISAPDFFRR